MIVGIRTLGWKRRRRIFAGGRMRWACWFEVERHELHSAKGWRLLRRTLKPVSEDIWRKAPATEERFERTRRRRDRAPFGLLEHQMETARMRHAWYRRKKAWDAFRASLPAANVNPDYHTETQAQEAAAS